MSAPRTIQTALVTGAAGAIGKAIVARLLARGDRVIATDVDEKALERLRAATRAPSGRFVARVGDVSDPGSWSSIVESEQHDVGPIDILVSNAGISPKIAGVRSAGLDISLDEWNRVVAVNLTGALLGIRATAPGMIETGHGRIVVIASQAARTAARIGGVHYSASKTGLLGLVRTFALELASSGVTVNAVAPGRIRSEMMDGASAEVNREALTRIPIGRFGTPADVAVAVDFLSSPEAGFITGTTLDVNGGAFMA